MSARFCVLGLALLCASSSLHAQPDLHHWDTRFAPYDFAIAPTAMALDGAGRIAIARSDAGDVPAYSITLWDGRAFTPLLSSDLTATTHALAFGPDGALYAGGFFFRGGGAEQSALARWNGAAWTLLPGFGAFDRVHALAFDADGQLYAAGKISAIGGQAVNNVARWDGAAWHPLGDGLGAWGNTVQALAFGADGMLYAAGDFGGHVARWDGSAWAALGGGADAPVHALDVAPDGSLYVAGAFSSVGGVPANRVAQWSGGAWSAVGASPDGDVLAVRAGATGHLYVVGAFDTMNGQAGNVAVRYQGTWSVIGDAGDTWYDGTYHRGTVRELHLTPDGALLIGADQQGEVAQVNGVPTGGLARWDGTQWRPLGLGLSNASAQVHVVRRAPDGDLYVGGSFDAIGGTRARSVARWDGQRWHALGEGLFNAGGGSGTVHAIAFAEDGSVYVGGDFAQAGALPASNVARWTGEFWDPLDGGLTGTVYSLTVGGGLVYAGGDDLLHMWPGSMDRIRGVGQWDGVQWRQLGGGRSPCHGVAGQVTSLRWEPEGLLIGGSFGVGGVLQWVTTNEGESTCVVPPHVATASGLVRWNGGWDGSLGRGWPEAPFSDLTWVRDMIRSTSGDLLVAVSASETAIAGLYRRDAQGWSRIGATGMSDAGGAHVGPYVVTEALDGSLYITGTFTGVSGTPAGGFARYTAGAWMEPGDALWIPGDQQAGEGRSLTVDADGAVWLGGAFGFAGGRPAGHLARYDPYAPAPEPPVFVAGVRPGRLATVPVGGTMTYSLTVREALAGLSMGARVVVQDPFAGASVSAPTGPDGRVEYTVTVPAGVATGTYAVRFRADKPGFATAPEVTSYLRVMGGSEGIAQVRVVHGAAALAAFGPVEILVGEVSAGLVAFPGIGTEYPSGVTLTLPAGIGQEVTARLLTPPPPPLPQAITFTTPPLPAGLHVATVTGIPEALLSLFAANPEGRDRTLSLAVGPLVVPVGVQGGAVPVFVTHAVTDAPAVRVIAREAQVVVAAAIGYGEVGSMASLLAGPHTFDVYRITDDVLVGSFGIDLGAAEGGVSQALLSGFLDPSANQNGPGLSVVGVGPSGVVLPTAGEAGAVSLRHALGAPYPNPFRERTRVRIELAVAGQARLVLHDLLGREVAVLVDAVLPAGLHDIDVGGAALAAGVYVVRLTTPEGTAVQRLTRLR